MAAEDTETYATPRSVPSIESCAFYHVMEIPGVGLMTDASWDLRGRVSSYLGNVPLRDKRVLEIGPASGFLTFSMEEAGAEVVCVELASDQEWDIVPNPDPNRGRQLAEQSRSHMERIRNGFWFAHERFGSRARVHYGSAYDLPEALGHFDVAVMASVLLHLRDPLRVLARCAELADMLIVTDLHYDDLSDDRPLASLIAGSSPDTWWRYTPEFVARFADILGFNESTVTFHQQLAIVDGEASPADLFTVVSTRQPGTPTRISPSNASEPASPGVYADRLEVALQAQARQVRLHEEHRREIEAHAALLAAELEVREEHRLEVEGYVAHLLDVIAARDAQIEHLGAIIRGELSPDDPT